MRSRAMALVLALASLGFGPSEGPIRMEPLDPDASPPTFVMRGAPHGPARMVFLHGMCGHALGYAQSFQWSAAKKGTLVAPQGDKPCGGPWAMWSNDLDALDARIVAAFRALGHEGPIDDVVLIGYSQGATRAEAMARKWPERYTRLILIAAPTVASPRGLSSLRAALMMAGERDRQDLMKAGTRAMRAAHVPSTFMVIPEATHGAMGPTPEKTMGAALDWLWANQKPD
jgi:pimeloyl-ACP methyl ester carboxylesterase